MSDAESYQLLDFGNGRKLERFGSICLDRPCPAAHGVPSAQPQPWTSTARFDRLGGEQGQWRPRGALPESWAVHWGRFQLMLKPTPFGHVGMFPEHRDNWEWLDERLRRHPSPVRVLNLFAYTGGSTLAAAAAGAEVAHIDAAKNVVQWARQNAAQSGLTAAPIRWIVEDARRFVRREVRRGHRYHAMVIDPPSYGHGPQGQPWRLVTDLMPLLKDCRCLLADDPVAVVLTCHSPGFGPAELGACLQESFFGRCSTQVEAKPLSLQTPDGRRLPAGVVARWPNLDHR